jgi:hypothetical protein
MEDCLTGLRPGEAFCVLSGACSGLGIPLLAAIARIARSSAWGRAGRVRVRYEIEAWRKRRALTRLTRGLGNRGGRKRKAAFPKP